jgi:cysteinyl-tRNA synthetase
MIDRLVEKGHAYVTGDGSVYFKEGRSTLRRARFHPTGAFRA